MTGRVLNTLFLCTHNSGRSQIAEALLNAQGNPRLRAFSAGSHPGPEINPRVRTLLERDGVDVGALKPKSWEVFATADAPVMDFIFTVCDKVAQEACPQWPGHPVTAHWGFPDPAAFSGSEAEHVAYVGDIYRQIRNRVQAFAALPFDKLDRLSLQNKVGAMGHTAAP